MTTQLFVLQNCDVYFYLKTIMDTIEIHNNYGTLVIALTVTLTYRSEI